MKEIQLRNRIRKEVDKVGKQVDAAKKFGISNNHLSNVLSGVRSISDEFARKFGYQQKEREFEKIKEAK